MRYVYLIALLFLFSMGCAQSKTKPITEFSQNDIKTGILVDVRTPEEYAAGHIDNSLNINFYDENFIEQFTSIDKDQPIFVYCKKGGRSAKAAHILDSLGYKSVVDLEGGYDALNKK